MRTTAFHGSEAGSSHWYYPDGRPCYELPKKFGEGMKVPTLADARKLNLLPSVTTILKVLHKQALVDWLREQTALAIMTTPRLPGEADDAFVFRVLHTERVQDQESTAARDRGTEMHAGIEAMFQGEPVAQDLLPWIEPAYQAVSKRGELIGCEVCVVGNGYAGKLDLQLKGSDGTIWLYDYKTTKKLPEKAAWPDHRLQLSAYAAAVASFGVRCANVYISTVEPGKFVIWEHQDEYRTFDEGFEPLLRHWAWATGYDCRTAQG